MAISIIEFHKTLTTSMEFHKPWTHKGGNWKTQMSNTTWFHHMDEIWWMEKTISMKLTKWMMKGLWHVKFNHINGVEKMIKNYDRDKLLFINGKVTILHMVSYTWLVTFMWWISSMNSIAMICHTSFINFFHPAQCKFIMFAISSTFWNFHPCN